jgi:hypothetical protein
MSLILAGMVFFLAGAAAWIAIAYWIDFLPTSRVDPDHYEIRYDHVTGKNFRHEHIVSQSWGGLKYISAGILAFLAAIWLGFRGLTWYWGPIGVLAGSLAGFLTDKRNMVVYYQYELKALRKISSVILVIFCLVTLGVVIHLLSHPPSMLLAEVIAVLAILLVFWLLKPVEDLIHLPAELTAKKQLYTMLRNDPKLIRNAEAFRRSGGIKTNYREFLKDLDKMSREKPTKWY